MIENTNNRWRIMLWSFAALLFLLPLVAMQFTDQVNWTGFDFLVFGGMIAAACGLYEIVVRLTGKKAYRAVMAAVIAGAFLIIWAQGAVGIFE